LRSRELWKGAALLCLAMLAACAGPAAPPGPPHPVETHAITDPDSTALGRLFDGEARRHPGLSGFDLITSGRAAFEARFAFARLAQRSIDAQYFIWAGDATGRNMLQALLDAADRGVRVRLLLDDLNLKGSDVNLDALNAHPNFHVRLFNPFTTRSFRMVDFLTDFERLDHRMHDKAFIVDNSIAVLGGRNMADQYFAVNDEANFRDVDLFAAGPIVRDASREFDRFWNSPWATSFYTLDHMHPSPEALETVERRLHAKIDGDSKFPFPTRLDDPYLEHLVGTVPQRLIWGQASLLYDAPDKPETSAPEVADELKAKVGGTVQRELLLESAYFVPEASGVANLCALARRGVSVRVLTNSLASTDEAAVYAGYMRHRDDLLGCGVELHELRPDAAFVRRDWTWLSTRSEAQLHTKAAVFDRDEVLVGSFNLDPRSRNINTEIAVLVRSPKLADKVARFIEGGMSPTNSFRLVLEDGHVVWVASDNGHEIRFTSSPVTGWWERFSVDLLSLLPIESQL
jgi:cardiolipin synthase C